MEKNALNSIKKKNELVNILVTLKTRTSDFGAMCQNQEKEKNTPLKLDEQHPIGLFKGSFNQ